MLFIALPTLLFSILQKTLISSRADNILIKLLVLKGCRHSVFIEALSEFRVENTIFHPVWGSGSVLRLHSGVCDLQTEKQTGGKKIITLRIRRSTFSVILFVSISRHNNYAENNWTAVSKITSQETKQIRKVYGGLLHILLLSI